MQVINKIIFMARIKQELEFLIHSSPIILFDYISNNSNLMQWFCDDLKAKDKDHYTFSWDTETRTASMSKNIKNQSVRIHWHDAPEEEYLELAVIKDDLTGDVLIKVTDFAEESEAKFNEEVWASDMETLAGAVGAH